MLAVLTLFTSPLMLLRRASHESRWYSMPVVSFCCWARRARRRCGGRYAPPALVRDSAAGSARGLGAGAGWRASRRRWRARSASRDGGEGERLCLRDMASSKLAPQIRPWRPRVRPSVVPPR